VNRYIDDLFIRYISYVLLSLDDLGRLF